MATILEIKALTEKRVRQQRSHIMTDGVAEILDLIVDRTSGGAAQTLDEVLAMGNDANAQNITNLADPINDQDAATKKYVDDNGGGSSLFPTTGTGTATGTVTGDIGANTLNITGTTGSAINYTADTHTFNGGPGDAFIVKTTNYSSGLLKISDAGPGSGAVYLGDSDDEGNGTRIYLDDLNGAIKSWADEHEWYVGSDEVFVLSQTEIEIGAAAFPLITSTADTHNFNVGAIQYLSLSAGDAIMISRDPANSDTRVYFDAAANSSAAQAQIMADFNDATKRSFITALADATTATITYTADTHNINGAIVTDGNPTFNGTLADAITGGKSIVNGLIID